MAKTSYQLIPPGYDLTYNKTLTSGDRFVIPNVRLKRSFLSRSRKKGVTQKSLIPIISPDWKALSAGDKSAWDSAGAVSNTTGFKLFIKDYASRLANGLTGYATPNDIYQVRVGRIQIGAPATGIKIAQLHPQSYWVSRKVRNTRSQFEPVIVTEDFAMPLSIKISYKTNLTPVGPNPSVRFYVVIDSLYQATTIQNTLAINFGLTDAWQVKTNSISTVKGLSRGYTMYIEAVDVQGDIWFDNVEVYHSGHNWARDAQCQDVHQDFTRAFFQVPKHWTAISIPTGAFFDSVYYN